jgi:hypothetical protein
MIIGYARTSMTRPEGWSGAPAGRFDSTTALPTEHWQIRRTEHPSLSSHKYMAQEKVEDQTFRRRQEPYSRH